jgi:hypothetical protein
VACVRDDEVELVRAGEVSDAGVADAGGLVRCDGVVPRAHLRSRRVPPLPPEEGSYFFSENPRRRCKEWKLLGTVCFLPSFR